MIGLKELNQGMLVSGRLSEVHIYNLKQYPFLVFNSLESIEISYNLEPLFDNQEGSYVEYTLKFKDGAIKNSKKEKENEQILKNMVQVLLSNRVRVDIIIPQKKYVGKKTRSGSKRRSSSRSK